MLVVPVEVARLVGRPERRIRRHAVDGRFADDTAGRDKLQVDFVQVLLLGEVP